MDDLNGVVLGALFGSVLGLGARFMEDIYTRRRRRKAAATALLVELRPLEAVLRALHASKQPSKNRGVLWTFFYRKARSGELRELMLFSPQTVFEVMKFAGLVNKLRAHIAEARSRESRAEGDEELLRRLATIAARRTPLVKAALIAEGAEEHLDSPSSLGPNQLPSPAFPDEETAG